MPGQKAAEAKYNILRRLIASFGGLLCTPTYTNRDTPILYLFNGQYFETTPSHVYRNVDEKVGNGDPLTIEHMHKIAARRGGKFLSPEYKTAREKHLWGCGDCGESFETTSNSIKSTGTWCNHCNGKTTWSIERIKQELIGRSITLLSTVYESLHQNMLWLCDVCGKEWNAEPNSVIKNKKTGCPRCAQTEKLTIEEMQEIAISRNGLCLSKEYSGSHTHLLWYCNVCTKTWWAIPTNIKSNKWCPYCSHCVKLTIEEMHELAFQNGGRCLSTVYVDCHTKLEWWCGDCAHTWWTIPELIKRGSWCPRCGVKRSKGEEKCKEVFDSLNIKYELQYKDPGLRRRSYDFLIHTNNGDFLVEYDGELHFREVYHFNKVVNFQKCREKDVIKTKFAIDNGYKLIRIDFKQIEEIETHITKAIQENKPVYFSTPSMYSWIIEGIKQDINVSIKNDTLDEDVEGVEENDSLSMIGMIESLPTITSSSSSSSSNSTSSSSTSSKFIVTNTGLRINII